MSQEEYNYQPGDGKLTAGFALLVCSYLSLFVASELPLPTWAKSLVAMSIPGVSLYLIGEGVIEKVKSRRKTSLRR